MQVMDILDDTAPMAPAATLLWEALIDVGERQDLGPGPLGGRAIVPILGGMFRGGPGMAADQAAFNGVVEAGGADRQLLRIDGAKELDALYEMRVTDGSLLTVRNGVIIDDTVEGPRYALSRIHVTAPNGCWDWLNRRLIVGTLQSARPTRQAVIIRAWLIDHERAMSD
jgi:hypothetical protein